LKGFKMAKLVLVECLSQFRVRYVVETPDDHPEFALDSVALGEVPDEFSQLHLSETIVSHHEVSLDEFTKLFDEDNGYCASWTPDMKQRCIHVVDPE